MSTLNLTPLIPRKVLFDNPDKASGRISPDGAHISYLAPVDGVLNVWVAPVDDLESAKPVTFDKVRGIRMYAWAYTNQHILYMQDKGGDENWRIYSSDLESGKIYDLTPFEGVQAQILEITPEAPAEILVGINNRDPQLHDIYKINVTNAELKLVHENKEGFANFISDDTLTIRFGVLMTPDGGGEVKKKTEDGWETFLTIPMEDNLTTSIVGFGEKNTSIYLTDSRERNTSALYQMDLASGQKTLIAEDPLSDVDDLLVHPTRKSLLAVAFNYERKHWQILEESIKEDFEQLAKIAGGEAQIVSWTLDSRQWLVAYTMDNGPVRYYLFNRDTKVARFLFTNRTSLEGLKLASMHPVVVPARDGWNLVNFLTLPVEYEGKDRPDEPLPMVLFIHGGPWARDYWGYSPYHQLLANRGYAVMSVNYRSSTGFGKNFLNAGNLEWAAAMHDDLIDSVDWAVKEGIADPQKVAIMGGSYGGYATLVGLTFTPEKFVCGVDIVGPSNLITLINSVPPYWQPMIELFAKRMGDHRTEEGKKLLVSRSPLTYAEKIVRPLLIGQGANDPRVNQAESDQIVQAMQEKNIPVTYVLYPDEGHGFARPENNLSFMAVTETFLAEHLGGRAEEIGEAFEGSSIKIPVGAETLPGVAEGLKADEQD